MILDRDDVRARQVGDPPPNCFYCTEPLEDPLIWMWSGTSTLAMHPDCAVEFHLKIGVDLLELRRRQRDVGLLPKADRGS